MSRGQGPTLRGRALMWLAQREHSRSELRTKLRRWAADPEATPEDSRPAASDADIERLLDELQASRQLSEARFAESRVHARQSRFGNRRIVQELRQHGVALEAGAIDALNASELERARAVHARKFGQVPSSPAERAKQVRFLAARGFTSDTIRRLLHGSDDD